MQSAEKWTRMRYILCSKWRGERERERQREGEETRRGISRSIKFYTGRTDKTITVIISEVTRRDTWRRVATEHGDSWTRQQRRRPRRRHIFPRANEPFLARLDLPPVARNSICIFSHGFWTRTTLLFRNTKSPPGPGRASDAASFRFLAVFH